MQYRRPIHFRHFIWIPNVSGPRWCEFDTGFQSFIGTKTAALYKALLTVLQNDMFGFSIVKNMLLGGAQEIGQLACNREFWRG